MTQQNGQRASTVAFKQTQSKESCMRYRNNGMLTAVAALAVASSVLSHSNFARAADESTRNLPRIKWDTTLNKFQFDQDKFLGQRFSAECPARTVRDAALEPAEGFLHSSDSAICAAALSAGQIDEQGGIATVQLIPGGEEFAGSNGRVTARSIAVLTDDGATVANPIHADYAPRVEWNAKFSVSGFANKRLKGQRFSLVCPSAPNDGREHRLFGTDQYPIYSPICEAAVHAGTVTREGGMVTVQMNSSPKKLQGSIRNGIESRNGPGAQISISFVRSLNVTAN